MKKAKTKSKQPGPTMPLHFPNDHDHVKQLLAESVRVNNLGLRWGTSNPPNPVASQKCFEMGWAYALAAAWLRCKLKGELK